MKKRNRMLAMLLAFTMVLTFMPMLAFAEGEEANADQQVIETSEEAVEETIAEEEPLAASEGAKVTAIKFIPADDFTAEARDGDDWFDCFLHNVITESCRAKWRMLHLQNGESCSGYGDKRSGS